MENIILQWDDICEVLFDELIHEEVQELNSIERKRMDTTKANMFKTPKVTHSEVLDEIEREK